MLQGHQGRVVLPGLLVRLALVLPERADRVVQVDLPDLQVRLAQAVRAVLPGQREQVLPVLQALPVRPVRVELNTLGRERGLPQPSMPLMTALKMMVLVMFVYLLTLLAILMMNPELEQLGKLIGTY